MAESKYLDPKNKNKKHKDLSKSYFRQATRDVRVRIHM